MLDKTKLKFHRFLNAILLVALLSMSGVMYVSAHGGDVTLIHACVNNRSGAVRIVSAATTCDASKETALDWGIQGPKGDTGETGPMGPEGEAGPAGPQGEPSSGGSSCELEWRIVDQISTFQISQECLIDSDHDLLNDHDETIYGTDPNNPDTDGDTLADGVELFRLGYGNTGNGCPSLSGGAATNPLSADSDHDTLSDAEECLLYLTNPLRRDSDDDGIFDAEDTENGLGYNSYDLADNDNDGLANFLENHLLPPTDPENPDSDGDGFSDGVEFASGFAYWDPNSHP